MSVYFFCNVKLFFKRAADGFGLKRFDDFKYLIKKIKKIFVPFVEFIRYIIIEGYIELFVIPSNNNGSAHQKLLVFNEKGDI